MTNATALLSGLAAATAIAASAALTPAAAQVFHLPPAFRPMLPKNEPVLRMTAVAGASLASGATIAVDDERLIITRPDGSTDVITLPNRQIRDVVNELQSKYPDALVVKTDYPLFNSRYLRSSRPVPLRTDSAASIRANPDEPELGLGFGAVFALADGGPKDDDRGLLSTTGFQLDLVGNFQAVGPRARLRDRDGDAIGDVPYSIEIYAQPRLGLAANQQLQISNEPPAGAASSTEAQFQDAIQQADQVALSLQFDMVLPVVSDRMDFIASPVYAVSWTRLADPGFPDVVVRDTIRDVETLFEPTLVSRARRALRQPLPLSEYGASGTFQFRRNHRPVFYVGGGYMWREVTQPRVTFTRPAPNTEPDRLSLRARLDTPDRTVWRAFFGARLAGVLDVRVDAAGPIGDRNSSPLLKVLLGRSFPTVRSTD